jgi:uncharacterized protein YuzE
MISTSYDREADAIYSRILPAGTTVNTTRELEPGLMLDLDAAGRIAGIEVLGVSARSSLPEAAE